MDSFTTITSTPAPAQPEIPMEFESGGGGGGSAYCVVSHSEEECQAPVDLEDGGGGSAYCIIAWVPTIVHSFKLWIICLSIWVLGVPILQVNEQHWSLFGS